MYSFASLISHYSFAVELFPQPQFPPEKEYTILIMETISSASTHISQRIQSLLALVVTVRTQLVLITMD
jgi:hypothetical protein